MSTEFDKICTILKFLPHFLCTIDNYLRKSRRIICLGPRFGAFFAVRTPVAGPLVFRGGAPGVGCLRRAPRAKKDSSGRKLCPMKKGLVLLY